MSSNFPGRVFPIRTRNSKPLPKTQDDRHNPSGADGSEEFDDERSDLKPFAIRGMILLVLLFGGFGSWAAIAPLDSGLVAPGVLIVDGRRRLVQHQEGGVIEKLMVSEGDHVALGQELLFLDQTRSKAIHDIVQGSYYAALAEEARLIAERDSLPTVAFPAALLNNADNQEIRTILDGQIKLFLTRRTSLTGQTGILLEQIEQSKKEIDSLSAERASKSKQQSLLDGELEGLRGLLAEGLTQKTRVLALERQREELVGEVNSLEAEIAKIENSINEKDLGIVQLEKGFQEQIAGELRDIQAQIRDSSERLADAQQVLDRVAIRAPIAGIVVNLRANTDGGVIGPGQVIMELVPTDEELVVDVRLSPSDIDLVRLGQSANVLFTAFDLASTPTLAGELTHISADRLVDDVTGQPFYQATIAISDSEISRLGENQRLHAGMPADVIIVAGERTMLEYLLRPIKLSFQRGWKE